MDHGAGLDNVSPIGHSITLVLQCFPFVTCCEPVAASSVAMEKSREEREGGPCGSRASTASSGTLRHVTTPPPVEVSIATCPR
jgi:hypothetical protein